MIKTGINKAFKEMNEESIDESVLEIVRKITASIRERKLHL